MPDSRDHKIEVTRLIPEDGSTLRRKETLEEHSEDESVSEEVTFTDLVIRSCTHVKAYGFSCSVPGCGRTYCTDCLSKARYCQECSLTLGPCCTEEMADGRTFCPQHRPLIDWSGPVRGVLETLIALGTLALSMYFLHRYGVW
jgi:hypothetical protein